MAYDPDAEWPFRARGSEHASLLVMLTSDARSGGVVVGAAGVGKSRLVEEVARASAGEVLRVIGTRAMQHTRHAAVAHLVAHSAPIASVEPAALYREVADALRARRNPTLVVHDAHLLDDGSAELVLHLVLDGAVRVLATMRSDSSAPDAMTALWQDGRALRLDLEPLPDDELGALLTAALGGPVASGSLHRLTAAAGGNPRYAQELLRSAWEAGTLRQADELWTWDGQVVVGDRLSDILAARLAGLDDAARDALAVVAIGEPLPLTLAARVVAPPALAQLERSCLITIADDGCGAICRVEHRLLGEAMIGEIGELGARSIRSRLADAAESIAAARPDGDDDAQLLQRAVWRVEGGGTPAPDEAVAAARLALLSHEPARARAMAQTVPSGHAQHLAAQVLRGRALVAEGRPEEGAALLTSLECEALACADDIRHEWLGATRVVLHDILGRATEAEDLLRRVEGMAADRRLARALRGNLLIDEGRLRETLEVTQPVVDEGILDAAAAVAAGALGEACANLGLFGRAARSQALLAELAASAIPDAERAGDYAVLQRVMCELLNGDADAAAERAGAIYRALATQNEHTTVGLGAITLALAHLAQGKLAQAGVNAREAVDVLRRNDTDGALPWALSILAQIEALSGDVSAASVAFDEARRRHRDPVPARSRTDLLMAQVRIRAAAGDVTGAGRLAQERDGGGSHADGSGAVAEEFVVKRAQQRFVAARLSRTNLPVIADQLEAAAADAECESIGLRARHIRALADRDAPALEALAARWLEKGARLDALAAATDAADMPAPLPLHDRLTALAARLRAECGDPVGLSVTMPGAAFALSRRESEVARMAACGLSNAAIAAQLVVSVRTVESHLYQAFGKLGIRAREELAVALGSAQR